MKLKRFVSNQNSNIYLNAAEQLNYQIEILDKKIGYAYVKNNNKLLKIYRNSLDVNDLVSYEFANNKFLSNKILQKEMPDYFPDTLLLLKKEESNDREHRAIEFAKSKNYKIVIKPNGLSLGAGVFVLPKNDDEIKRAINYIFTKFDEKRLILEEYISGKKEYRITLFQDSVLDILERQPAFVVGDGISSIQEIINRKNSERSAHDFKIITIDEFVTDHLAQNKMTLRTILKENKYFQLRQSCNFSQGGEVNRINLQAIDEEYLKLFRKIRKLSKINFIGIDLITDDIEKPMREQKIGINEINHSPMPNVHFFADLKEKQPLASAKQLLQMILK